MLSQDGAGPLLSWLIFAYLGNHEKQVSQTHPGGEGEYYTMKIRLRLDEVMKRQSQTAMTEG